MRTSIPAWEGEAVSKIDILRFFHILGAFLICGGAGVGIAAGIAMAQTTSVKAISLLSITSHRAAQFVTLPGSLLILATGTWLIADYPFFELEEFWLWSSYVLWVAAAALDHGVLGPGLTKLHAEAGRLNAQGVADSVELQTLAGDKRSRITGMVLLLLLVIFLALMVFRPE
jgi:uncharacterized membrane protein